MLRKLKMMSILEKITDLVFVPKCSSCAGILKEGERVLCRVCRVKYDLLCHRKCRACGNDICSCDCTKEHIAANGVWRLSKLCAYLPNEQNSPFKAMLYNFKHKHRADVCDFFAFNIAEMIKKKHPEYKNGYTICFVPRSRASYKKYGYDHMQKLSSKVSRLLGIPCESMFYRTKSAKVQKELGRVQRFENTQKSIDLLPKYKNDSMSLKERRFILLDDVCVTGASLGRCASLLISFGACEVRSFVIGVRP